MDADGYASTGTQGSTAENKVGTTFWAVRYRSVSLFRFIDMLSCVAFYIVVPKHNFLVRNSNVNNTVCTLRDFATLL